jgi:hypothetical protein
MSRLEASASKATADSRYNLSKDYERLFALICQGERVPAWANTYSMFDENGTPYRDICEVRRTQPYEILIGCRGTSYGNVWPFMRSEGPELDLFSRACRSCDLTWVDPGAEEAS